MRFENALPCAAAVCVAALLAACAASPVAIAPEVPQSLRVPDRLTVSHELPATGVQIYECVASKVDPTRFEWVFKAPEAELFDTAGHRVGKHYGGPTWEANDGSKVVGAVKASDDGPDSTAIPWLLLVAKSTSGPGAFSRIQSIQRINTVGGKAPAGGCTEAQAGKEARVPYKATYYFYVPSP
jgi:hypothetical protein